MNSTLTERAHKLRAQRQALLTDMAGLRRLKHMPLEALGKKQIHAFTMALRARLLEKDRVFSKKYLKLLVEEIRYQNRQLVMKGSYTAKARAVGDSKRARHRVKCPLLVWIGSPSCTLYEPCSLSFQEVSETRFSNSSTIPAHIRLTQAHSSEGV